MINATDQAVLEIRQLLEHGYTADSFVREMMQNADDAEARRLVIEFRPEGLGPQVENPLLQGPLLLVANDGNVHPTDIEALHRASGGNKRDDAAKVGRFGLGLKSIFHWCEAFLYCGVAAGHATHGVVDPYVRPDGVDPVNPEWQTLSDEDETALLDALRTCLGGVDGRADGLLLVAPLRNESHLNRGHMRLATFLWNRGASGRPELFDTERLPDGKQNSRPILAEHVLVLAQCAHLQAFVARWPGGNFEVATTPSATTSGISMRLGRYRDGPDQALAHSEKDFGCVIVVRDPNGAQWEVQVVGAESTAPVALDLRRSPEWPMDMEEVHGRPGVYENRPRKAVGHGAVTLLRWPTQFPPRIVTRWAAFLPLDVHYSPHEDSAVARSVASEIACDILLHGYVFVTPDRKAVYGWTKGGDEDRVDSRWNRAVLEETCLHLLPKVIARATPAANSRTKSQLLAALNSAERLRVDGSHITKRDVLIPELGDAARYTLMPSSERSQTRVVRGWDRWNGHRALRNAILGSATTHGLRVAIHEFIVSPFDRDLPDWTAAEFQTILQSLPEPTGATVEEVDAVIGFVIATFGSSWYPSTDRAQASRAARIWALRVQAAGYGPAGRKRPRDMTQIEKDLLAWLCDVDVGVLPVSRGTCPAVERLAGDELPLLFVPNGARSHSPVDHRVKRECASLLPKIVIRMQQAQGAPPSRDIGPASWRRLARDIVGIVGLKDVLDAPDLRDLPLIPAWSPKQPEFLISPADLRRRAETRLVFFHVSDENDDEAPAPRGRSSKAPDAREWVEALAGALPLADCPCIVDLVDGFDGIDTVKAESVAKAVIKQAKHVTGDVATRMRLFALLVRDHQLASDDRKRALRLLAHGHVPSVDELKASLWVEASDIPLALALGAVMRQRHEAWRVVPSDVLAQTTDEDRKTLGVRVTTDRDLLDVLQDPRLALDPAALAEDERIAILHIATANDSLFRSLPLHAAQASPHQGRAFVAIRDGAAFRAGFPVPAEVDAGVYIIESTPDGRVQDRYNRILSEFGVASLVAVAMNSDAPHLLSNLVLDALRQPSGNATPLGHEFSDQREKLLERPWIPTIQEGTAMRGVAPRDIVDDVACDESLRSLVACLIQGMHSSAVALASTVAGPEAVALREVCEHLNGGRNVAQALRDVVARHKLRVPADWATVPNDATLTPKIWDTLIEVDSLGKHRRGWGLIQAVARSGATRDDTISLASALAGSFNDADWVTTLNSLVPPQVPVDAKDLVEAWFTLAKGLEPTAARRLLGSLTLLAADNEWHLAKELTPARLNVPERHQPHAKTREWLGVEEFDNPTTANGGESAGNDRPLSPSEVITHVEKYRGPVEWPVLGAVFCLCGSTDPDLRRAIDGWLGEQKVDEVRRGLEIDGGLDMFRVQRTVRFFLSESNSREMRLPSLEGSRLSVRFDNDIPLLVERVGKDPWFLDITLRRFSLANLKASARSAVLKETAVTFARAILGRDFAAGRFEKWWAKVVSGTQANIDPARQLLLDELPVKLAEFRLEDSPGLGPMIECLKNLTRHKLERGNVADEQQRRRVDSNLRDARKRLTDLLREPRVAGSLRGRVRAMLGEYAYSRASVLLELLQNADDALEQQRVMTRCEGLPDAARAVVIELCDVPGAASPTVRLSHWGRLINDHGGNNFLEGRQYRWDQDLYLMARFQVSAKRDAEDSTTAVQSTGRFGLGFKSVHLVSDDPVVRSGSLAFRFEAALVPAEVTGELASPMPEVDGHPATTIELPLAVEFEPADLLKDMFSRLMPVVSVFTAMARQIAAVTLPAQYGGEVAFEPLDVPGAPGWAVTRNSVRVGHREQRLRLLRYRPTTPPGSMRTLLLALDSKGVPVPMPPEVPTFWVVAPTEECWEFGYCINGDFKLDTGRVRVDFKAEKSASTLDTLGSELGRTLVELADAVEQPLVRELLGFGGDAKRFFAGLWHVLARGLGGRPERAKLDVIERLHKNDRGLGLLAANRASVPSGLSAPWPLLVGPIRRGSRIYVASDAAAGGSAAELLSTLPDLLQCAGPVVRAEVFEVLARLHEVQRLDFSVVAQLQAWSANRHEQLSFEDLDRLAALAERSCWEALESECPSQAGQPSGLAKWASGLRLPAADGGQMLISSLLLPPEAAAQKNRLSGLRGSFDDELMRSAFAPSDCIAAAELVESATRIDVFLRLRVELRADAERLAAWTVQAPAEAQQTAAAAYLGRGKLGAEVGAEIRRKGGLPWANTRKAWQTAATTANLSPDESQTVEIALFGAFQLDTTHVQLQQWQQPVPPQAPPLHPVEAKRRLDCLWETWRDPEYRRCRMKELRKELWPNDWTPESPDRIGGWLTGDLSQRDTKRAWIVLFLLAHVQGLGMKAVQHQSFVSFLLKQPSSRHRGVTWFDRLFGADAPDGTWIDFLDEWSRDRISGYRPFGFWMRVLPDMYAATKWWRTYAESLRLPRRCAPTQSLLAPGSDPDLSGDPDSADVPSMAGAVNRLEWIIDELQYFGVLASEYSQLSSPSRSYQPSPTLTDVLRRLGFFRDGADESYSSESVYAWLSGLIGPERASFHDLGKTPLELDSDDLLR